MSSSIHRAAFIERDGTYIFPLELWLAIFQLDDLEEEDLCHLTLVCHFFRSIAQPFLFDELIITLQSPLGDYQKKYLQTASYLCRFEERLEFITSSRMIALGVHFVAIMTSMNTSLDHLSDGLGDASNVINKLVDAFGFLPNLNEIHNVGYIMTSRMVRQIYQMPQLRFLSILRHSYHDYGGALERGLQDTRAKPRLVAFSDSQFSVPYDVTLVGRHHNGAPTNWWLPLLSPQTTRFIDTTNVYDSESSIEWLCHGEPKAQLKGLTLNLQLVSSPHFRAALAQCSALQELKFPPGSAFIPPTVPEAALRAIDTLLQTNTIPHLQEVEVPPDFALALVRCRPLNKLTIWDTTVVDLALATSIIEEITQRRLHLSHFSATLDTFSIPWFISAIELPYLEDLSLSFIEQINLGEDALKELCQQIQSSNISPKLLSVKVTFKWLPRDPQLEDREFDELLPGLTVSLKERCPKLERFHIKTNVIDLNMFATDSDLETDEGQGEGEGSQE